MYNEFAGISLLGAIGFAVGCLGAFTGVYIISAEDTSVEPEYSPRPTPLQSTSAPAAHTLPMLPYTMSGTFSGSIVGLRQSTRLSSGLISPLRMSATRAPKTVSSTISGSSTTVSTGASLQSPGLSRSTSLH